MRHATLFRLLAAMALMPAGALPAETPPVAAGGKAEAAAAGQPSSLPAANPAARLSPATLPAASRLTATSRTATRPAAGVPLPKGAIARLGPLLFRQGGQVWTLAFSPDGKMLLSASQGRIRLWEVPSGMEILTLLEDSKANYLPSAGFAAGGKMVLGCLDDKTAAVWDVETGKRIDTLPVPNANFVVSPDGGTLALTDGQNISLWDVKTRSERKRLGTGYGPRFSGDGKRVAVDGSARRGGIADIPISVYDTSTGKEVRKITIEKATPIFTGIALSGDGKRLAVCAQTVGAPGMKSCIASYDVDTGAEQFKVEGGFLGMVALAFSPDGKVLASIGQTGLTLYDASNGKSLDTVSVGAGIVSTAAFSPDSRTLAVGGQEGAIRLYDLAGKTPLPAQPDMVWVAVLPGKRVVTADDAGFLSVWDGETGTLARTAKASDGRALALAASPAGNRVAAAPPVGQPVVYDVATLAESIRVKTSATPRAMAFSADGKTLGVAGQGDGDRFSVIDLSKNCEVAGCNLEFRANSVLAVSPDLGMLAGGSSTSASLINAATGASRIISGSEPGRYAMGPVCFSAGGDMVAWCTPTGASLTESASGKVLVSVACEPRPTGCTAIAISPDGRMLAQGHGAAGILLWDAVEGRALGELVGHRGAVRWLSFSADSAILASASADGTALVWDLAPFKRAAVATRPSDATELAALWAQLAEEDPAKAYRAVHALVDMPQEAVTLLRERLRPTEAIPAGAGERIRGLIAELGDSKYAVRERAYHDLEALGEAALPFLVEASGANVGPEARTRIDTLLQTGTTGVSGPMLRVLRSVVVLNRIGSDQAVAVLEALAKGAESRQTAAAKAALSRLAARRNGS